MRLRHSDEFVPVVMDKQCARFRTRPLALLCSVFFRVFRGSRLRTSPQEFAGRQRRIPIYFSVDPALVAALFFPPEPSAS